MAPGGATRGPRRERSSAWTAWPGDGMHRVPAFKSAAHEIPPAYKDIDEVMEHARDLVEVKYVLKQFVNVKGD
jgi:hypothetical protein